MHALRDEAFGAQPVAETVEAAAPIVVLVDDEVAYDQLIGDILVKEMGCYVLVCTRADQVEPIVAGTRPALVLLDLVLPGGGGLAALEALKANPATSGVPVIVCTAVSLRAHQRQEVLASGAAAILDKPFDLDDLLTLVGAYCPRALQPACGAEQRSRQTATLGAAV